MTLRRLFDRLRQDEEGQDLIEYALLATFISLMVIAGAHRLGESIRTWYITLATNVDTQAGS